MAEILLKVALNHNNSINLQSSNFATIMGTLGGKTILVSVYFCTLGVILFGGHT